MKSIIIFTLTFVLLIPTTIFAQESLDCSSGSYHGLDNNGNDACRDIETNKVVKTLPKSNTSPSSSSSNDNPFAMFFKFIENIFKGFSGDSIEKSVQKVSNSIEKSVESVSDSIPVNVESLSGKSESGIEDCSKYKEEVKHSSDVDKIFVAVQKTDACEQRNKQITIKQGTQPSQTNYPTVTMTLEGSRTATADIKINTVRVADADYYKIININMQMTMNMKLNDRVYFSPTALWNLKSPDGEIYVEQCHGRQADMMTITGKQNPNITWDICYHVEKDLNKFDLLNSGKKIGMIILD